MAKYKKMIIELIDTLSEEQRRDIFAELYARYYS